MATATPSREMLEAHWSTSAGRGGVGRLANWIIGARGMGNGMEETVDERQQLR